jgi:hypothetical protein
LESGQPAEFTGPGTLALNSGVLPPYDNACQIGAANKAAVSDARDAINPGTVVFDDGRSSSIYTSTGQ